MKVVLSLFLILFQFEVFAQSCKPGKLENLSQIATTTCSNEAIEMIAKLKTQGFHCDEPSLNTPKRGILCKGKVGSYSQPLCIYISPNYKNKSQEKIDMNFHGHRLNGMIFNFYQVQILDTKKQLSGWLIGREYRLAQTLFSYR